MDKLSDDVLLEIFSYLDPASLQQLCKVDEQWENLIKTSRSTMRKFTVKIFMSMDEVEKKLDVTDARQSNVTIEHLNEFVKPKDGRLLKALEPHKETVIKAHLYQNSLSLETYSAILNGFERLTHLNIAFCRVPMLRETSVTSVELPKLKHLTISGSEWSFFKLLHPTDSLISLKVDIHLTYIESDFVDFVAECPSLKVLVLNQNAKRLMNVSRNFPFHLMKLSVDNLFDPILKKESVIDFLRQQKSTLRELEVKNAPRDSVLRFILAEMWLTKLHIGISGLQDVVNYFDLIPKNRHLKTLIMRGNVTAVDVVKGIIAQYPDIETLKFFKWELDDASDLLIHISTSLRNLKHLRLPSLDGIISPTIDLRQLKSLHVSRLEDEASVINWKFLSIYSPNVEKLSIGFVSNASMSNSNIESVTMKAKALRELCFGTAFELDNQCYNIIKTTSRNLRKLTIFTRDVEKARTNATRIHSGGLDCLILNNANNEFSAFVEESEPVIGPGSFNSIENVAAFIRPRVVAEPVAPSLAQARQNRRRQFVEMHQHIERQRIGRRRFADFHFNDFPFHEYVSEDDDE